MAGPEEIIFDLHKFDVTFWLRFLDDVFYIWTQAEEKPKYFLYFLIVSALPLNSRWITPTEKISYLDVLIYKSRNGRLGTTLYTKTTDTPVSTNNILSPVTDVGIRGQYLKVKRFNCIGFVQTMMI